MSPVRNVAQAACLQVPKTISFSRKLFAAFRFAPAGAQRSSNAFVSWATKPGGRLPITRGVRCLVSEDLRNCFYAVDVKA